MDKKIKKLYKLTENQKKANPEQFYFDNGQVCNNKDYEKDNIKYSVMKVNTDVDTTNHLVYLLIVLKNKSIPQMLVKEFKTARGTEKYFKELCTMIENNSNDDIIEKCYSNIYENTAKPLSIIDRLFTREEKI